MTPVLLTSKSLLLYTAMPWLIGGVALGYMGNHFGSQIKASQAKAKRQKQEIKELHAQQRQLEEQIAQFKTKLDEVDIKPASKPSQSKARVASSQSDDSKVFFLKSLMEQNVRLREEIQNENP